jgi:hypothetical protein
MNHLPIMDVMKIILVVILAATTLTAVVFGFVVYFFQRSPKKPKSLIPTLPLSTSVVPSHEARDSEPASTFAKTMQGSLSTPSADMHMQELFPTLWRSFFNKSAGDRK